ncbi:T9SS type A sorting domain-containing protein [Luteirhabdus pelagi]|uniref:T9SS type A sorting domain-containing protein n=1 Tax=Luteirhabdus pelagi TaxID=2792783 RepID=UPI001939CE2E|nr:T9SS type A sorting domain-containing protein [Luteirhabdus pelagi]
MNFRWILFVWCLICSNGLKAQELYYVTEDNNFYRLDLQDYSSTFLYDMEITGIGTVVDIAFDTQGNLFAITNFDLILQIDLDNQSYEIFYTVTTPGTFPGLVANAQDELFFGAWFSEKLYKFNPIDETVEELIEGVPTPGDFTFYKGNLLFPNANDNSLGSYNGSDISFVGCAQGPLFSLVNVFTDCDNNEIYGIDDQNNLYRYDVGTNAQELLTQVDAPGIIYGAATMSEAFASDCPLVELNQVNCSLGTEAINSYDISVYPNPTTSEIFFQPTTIPVTKVVLRDLQGRLIIEDVDAKNSVSLSTLTSGIYFMELYIQDLPKPFIQKIIKQ